MSERPDADTAADGSGSPYRQTGVEGDSDGLEASFEEAIARINVLTREAELARLEFEQVFDAVADATLIFDLEGRVLRANAAALRLAGVLDKADILGVECRTVLGGEFCGGSRCILERIRRGDRRLEEEVTRPVGTRPDVPMLLTATPLRGLGYELAGVVVQFKDVTARKRQEEELLAANRELNRLASIDALTQIANRRAFDSAIDREWRRMRRQRRPLSLILGDIDEFKPYNDHYGHPAGDLCLREVAGCIARCARRPGDFAARFGGEEFAVILADTLAPGADRVAEAIRREVEQLAVAHARSDVAPVITISLGVATANPAADADLSPEGLVAAADAALYRAKAAGRNRVVMAPDPSA